MKAVVITALLTLAIAFPAGWLLCRVWLQSAASQAVSNRRLNELLKAQRDRYRRRIQVVQELFKRNEVAHRQELDDLRSALADARRAQAKQAQEPARPQAGPSDTQPEQQHDAGLLRIERDELLARIQRLQVELNKRKKEKAAQPESIAADKAVRGELREQLAEREHQVRELGNRLEQSELRVEELVQEIESWKRRLAPLTVQLRKQRELIRLSQEATEQTQPASPAVTGEAETPDDLQKIKGIGPALERRLQIQGIARYAQLAEMSPSQLTELADRLAISTTLPIRDAWAEQARQLVDGTAEPAVAESAVAESAVAESERS